MRDTKTEEQAELLKSIHMRMLEQSQSANKCGELTVIPIGFAAAIAFDILVNQKKKWEKDAPKIDGDTSDGYHTFNELYEYRMLYNALVFNEWATQGKYDVHKSYYHSDGMKCFGGGWFVVVASTPYGQITNHYENKHWNIFNIPHRQTAAKWDGKTPQEVTVVMKELAAHLSSKDQADQGGGL